jgi:glucose/arabinose dehydrogenase
MNKFQVVMRIVFKRWLLLFMLLAALPSTAFTPAAAQTDPPCNGWTLHTRTLPTICPEVILDGLTGQGVAAIGSIAFDANGDLYISRPATGQVLRLTPHNGIFDAPEVIASGLDFPGGVACSGTLCYAATDTTITRLTDGKAIVNGLPSGSLRPLRIGPDGRLYTMRGAQIISLAIDGTDEHTPTDIPTPPMDFAWSLNGTR